MSHLLPWLSLGCVVLLLTFCWRAQLCEGNDQATAAAPDGKVAEVLASLRGTLGYPSLDKQSAVLLEGTATHLGTDARYSLLFTPRGEFLERIDGPLNEQTGFDGATTWAVDWTGMPRQLDLTDLESTQFLIWVQTGRWLAEDSPFDVELVNRSEADGRVTLRLRLRKGVLAGELTIEPGKWLLKRSWIAGNEIWEFSDFRPALGAQIPHRLAHAHGGFKNTYVVQSVAAASPGASERLKPITARPADVVFELGAAPKVELRRLPTGHLFVRPQVNGQDVGWFALDTGSGIGMTIAPALADSLKLPTVGRTMSGRAGKPAEASIRKGETFRLGPVTIRNSYYVELPVEFLELMKQVGDLDVAGTCGWDLFCRIIADVDLAGPTLLMHDPAEFAAPAGLAWHPLAFNQRIPCVRCSFEGDREEWFQLDTGAGGAVLFHAPAVKRLQLLQGGETSDIQVGGVGGMIDARLGQVRSFRVPGTRAQDVNAVLITGKEGALTDPYTAGTFGAELLGPVRLIFDYAQRRVAILEPVSAGK